MGRTAAPQVRWNLISDRFTASLLDGDESAVHRQVLRLRHRDVPVRDIVERLFVPAAVAVGDGWEQGTLSVAEEHRASQILTDLLGGLHARQPGRRRGTVVVATCQDEHHTLPTSMAAAALREDRWHVEHLGSGVPARGLVRFVADAGADLMVLSVTLDELAEASQALAHAIEREGVPTLVGGPGRTLTELCDLAAETVTANRPDA